MKPVTNENMGSINVIKYQVESNNYQECLNRNKMDELIKVIKELKDKK